MSEQQGAWLLTWNPTHSTSGSTGQKPDLAIDAEQHWVCPNGQPAEGDVVYLLRLGSPPCGLIARGVITREPYEAADRGETGRFIDFRVVESRPDCAGGLLPLLLLQQALPQQAWSSTVSGAGMTADVAVQVEVLWHEGEGKHSLRQFVDWYIGHVSGRRVNWLQRYREIAALGQALCSGEAPLDEAALARLWRDKSNGVSGLGPGVMAADAFARNLDFLRDVTRKIIEKPDAEIFFQVMEDWKRAVEAGAFSVVNQAAIKRTFAALAPDRYTCMLRNRDCKALLSIFDEHFGFRASGEKQLWPELNAAIQKAMREAGLGPEVSVESNVAMWQLLEAAEPSKEGDSEDQEIEDESPQDPIGETLPVLNQILYGPPGTGKTYAVVDEALRILDPALLGDPAATRAQLVARFDQLRVQGQIIFCTFHQSFSYEDFVEGLRAVTLDGAVHYRVEDGVFKRLCERARQGRAAASDPFDQALQRLRAQFDANDGRLLMSTAKGREFEVEYEGGDTFKVFPQSSAETQKYDYRANMHLVRQLYQTGSKEGIYNASYVGGMLTWLQEQCGLPPYQPPKPSPDEQDKFVLIIDEINRGNISRIFGELITLIEPSKRLGSEEALEVVLPYSRDAFGVPANLYLIGTMNTADRSLAGLDIALRRRFVFREMPPQPHLLRGVEVDGVDIEQLLTVMNQRIEVLLDRDHCLGHAYFMPLKDDRTFTRLSAIFRDQVLPLLQEYFFEDWQRIQWVLNDHRKDRALQFVSRPVVDHQQLFGADVDVGGHGVRWLVNDDAFGRIAAYRDIVMVDGASIS